MLVGTVGFLCTFVFYWYAFQTLKAAKRFRAEGKRYFKSGEQSYENAKSMYNATKELAKGLKKSQK